MRAALPPDPPPAADASAAERHPEIHEGRDGWLFLTGGSNRVLTQYAPEGLPRALLWRWRRVLARRTRDCARLGIRYFHVVAPEKLTVYPERTAGLGYDPGRAPALRLWRWLRLSPARTGWIDLVGPLRAARAGPPLYLRTDSHWTFEGCTLAYGAICARMGVRARTDIADRRAAAHGFYVGDLGSKLVPARGEDAADCLFASQARRIQANAFLRHFEALGRGQDAHIGAHAVFRNDDPAADPRRLVLFGDSYAQHTPTPWVATLTAFLADTFREVHFVWSTSVDWDYLAAVRPDFVLGEIAERFLIEVPPRAMGIERLAELALARKGTGSEGPPAQ